ncbi:MAG: putative lipoprotein [Thermoleophilia bacterium]|nr:putative lipoprotein [Thermoleophilia bacterium]
MRIRPLASVVLPAVLALAVAACGGDSASPAGSTTAPDARDVATTPDAEPAPGAKEAAQATATLDIALANIGGKEALGLPMPEIACTKSLPATCSATLGCPTAEGAVPREVAACEWLATDAARTVLVPPASSDDRQACTMIYGGPETADVTGTLDGTKVAAKLGRQNGCEISRWEQALVLWSTRPKVPAPPAGGATGSCPPADPDAPVSSDGPPCPDVISDPPEAFR